MALSGIDAQIMTQRATDTATSASALNKRNELMQDYMALQRKTEDEQQDRMVIALEQKDGPRITQENKGSGQNAGKGQHGKNKKPNTSENSEEEHDPGMKRNRIDIRI